MAFIVARNFNALLTSSASIVLDSKGNGIVATGPTGLGNVWYPIQVGVTVFNTASTPTAQLFIGPLLPSFALKNLGTNQLGFIGGTATGQNDSIGFVSNLAIPPGQALIVQWLGGTAGSLATMNVTGTQSATYFS